MVFKIIRIDYLFPRIMNIFLYNNKFIFIHLIFIEIIYLMENYMEY